MKTYKKILAFICAITLVVTSAISVRPIKVSAIDTLANITVTEAINFMREIE